MANLSLNGTFDYPVELKQSLTVDGRVVFLSSVSQGTDNNPRGQHALTVGNECVADGDYSISFGNNSIAYGLFSFACGLRCNTTGEGGISLGNKSSAGENTFVWQGYADGAADTYYSHGEGSFNINPHSDISDTFMSPICGFWVENHCITEYMSSEAAKRILNNANEFTAPQIFLDDVGFGEGSNVTVSGSATFLNSVVFSASTVIDHNNNPSVPTDDLGVANHHFVNGVAVSAVTHMNLYYPDDGLLSDEEFENKSGIATPLGFVRTYVTSAINNVDLFISQNSDMSDAAASRKYAFTLATSASTYMRSVDNRFTGENRFGGDVTLEKMTFATTLDSTMDLRRGKVLVKEHSGDLASAYENAPATEMYALGLATSGVNQILNRNNTYDGDNTLARNTTTTLNGGVAVYGTITSYGGSKIDLREGGLKIPEPVVDEKTPVANAAATTTYARFSAASAVNRLLTYGGTFLGGSTVRFDGNVKFAKDVYLNGTDGNGRVHVAKIDLADSSDLAASTEFVHDTLATSSASVRTLMLDGTTPQKKGETLVNKFTAKCEYLDKNIYVSTMEDGDATKHAASTEFVKRALELYSPFDLFDMKFMDYRLDDNSRWRLQGSRVYRDRRGKYSSAAAYDHIYGEYMASSELVETIAGINIPYYQANDHHRIYFYDGSESMGDNGLPARLDSLFRKTGISWFYVLDTSEKTGPSIILPKTSYNFKAQPTEEDIEGYVRATLPNHHHKTKLERSVGACNGDFVHRGSDNDAAALNLQSGDGIYTVSDDVFKASNNATVQPPATNMLLYFYCG